MKKKEGNNSSRSGHSNAFATEKTWKLVICIFLIISTFAVYSQVQDHDFINYDDDEYVTENWNVKAKLNLNSVIWAFTTSHNANWFPITWLSHILDYQLYELNPKGHHLTSLLLHILNALLLFFTLSRMTGALWQSGLVAALFALHPFNVESVAWVAERKNVLSTFFWFLTMGAYVHYVERPSVKRYSLVVLVFVLGLMSKPMLVTLPFVLLMMDYWPLRRLKSEQDKGRNEIIEKFIDKRPNIWPFVWEKIPLFLLTAGSSITTFIVQKSGGALDSLQDSSLSARVTNAIVSYLEYLKKALWPEGLAVFYPHPGNALAVWQVILCGIVLMSITVAAIKFIRKAPYLAVGWFWYLGTLVPVIGIVQVGSQAMADRYAYVPLIGIFIMIAWGLPQLFGNWRHRNKVLTLAAGIWITALTVLTWVQVGHWKNSITIFQHAINVTDKKYPDFYSVHNNLGNAFYKEKNIKEAVTHYKTALRLNPDYATAHGNLGNALLAEGKIEEASFHFKLAISLKPDLAQAHNNFGNALLAEGKIEEASFHFKLAIKLQPNFALAHYNLGLILKAKRKTEEAISEYKIAIKINPDFPQAHNNLGNALLAEGKIEAAISHYKIAISLKSDFAEAHYNLGVALSNNQMAEQAHTLR